MDRWRAEWNRGLEGGRERDNDDETSAGQNRAIGWIEVKLIGLRELWRVKRGWEKERWIKGWAADGYTPGTLCWPLAFHQRRILRHKRGAGLDKIRWRWQEAGGKNLAPSFVVCLFLHFAGTIQRSLQTSAIPHPFCILLSLEFSAQ